ncbi:MAG: phosphoribosylaminoimidazolesuccinocarboxamide synthase, partial [Candidatus Subteraquimicrobiales bacterium]|nr:phosphoribosylaminoimidazolesuccinocarboxamide synthase [Candidatus Subteraquimicrobiales bacterium]
SPLKPSKQGKVRDIYDFGDRLVIVATDRISAYDSILPDDILYKGKILTYLSLYWFEETKHIVENHFISADVSYFPQELQGQADYLRGRSMLVRKAEVIPIECVVRGYLSGSGWKEYQKTGSVCGVSLPEGLKESDKLPEPIFTPATKAESGHDENISFKGAVEIVGLKTAEELRDLSLKLYKFVAAKTEERGIIIADTKFEFGKYKGKTILIDEIFTPDSSRFWAVADYKSSGPQKSFDKQFVRDYLDSIGWNHEPPMPRLPLDVIEETSKKYIEAYERITGKKFSDC